MIEIFPGASVGAPGCYHCTYYLAVTGLTESTYTLVASIMATVTSLQDGLTQSGQVGLGGWVYYAFTPGSASNRDYKINLVSTSGNADLYVTLGECFAFRLPGFCADRLRQMEPSRRSPTMITLHLIGSHLMRWPSIMMIQRI